MAVKAVYIAAEEQFLNKWFQGHVPERFAERVEAFYGALYPHVRIYCSVCDDGVVGYCEIETHQETSGYHGLRVEIDADDSDECVHYTGDYVFPEYDAIWLVSE